MTDTPAAPAQSPPAPVTAMIAVVMLSTAVGVDTLVTATAVFRGTLFAELGPTWPPWLRIGAQALALVALAAGRRRLTVAATVLLLGALGAGAVYGLGHSAVGTDMTVASVLADALVDGVTVVALVQLARTHSYWTRPPARHRWWSWMIAIALPSMVIQFVVIVLGGLLLSAPDLRIYSPEVRLAGPVAAAWLYVLYTRRVPRHARATTVGIALAAQVPAIAVQAYQLDDGTHTPTNAVIVSCGPWVFIALILLVIGLRAARRAAAQAEAE
jgi:hypothetical protein